jgi:hypothetical protein
MTRRTIGRRKQDRWRVAAGIVLGAVLTSYAFYTTGCDQGTVSGPDPVVVTTPAPTGGSSGTVGTPTVVQPPGETPEHDAKVKNGFYSVTNETGVPQFYCAAAFGVLPGGEQGAGSNIFEDQGVRQPKDIFSGQAPKTAACQYKEIQVDLTQSKDCRNFDWTNVLAAEVYPNPGFIAGTETETLPDEYTYIYSEGQNSENWCGSRIKVTWTVKKFRCSGEIVKTEKSRDVEEGKSCCTETWDAQEPVRENETEYGACEQGGPTVDTNDPPTIDCPGHKTRTVEIVIYEINSCTEETREKSRIKAEEQAPCTAQCEQAFCHTEHAQIVDWSPFTVKWQCQNVPPGTPGHWPNHFSWPHGDFFGSCTEAKCYSITN